MVQAQLNDYKYIIVPKKFDDFKKENQYQTSTLIKHLFTQKGFKTAYEDDLPLDLVANRCLGLTVYLVDNSSMFTTKASLKLEDCLGKEVFATQEGKSKIKDFKDSYNEAIREAFNSIMALNYVYSGKGENTGPVTVSYKDDVKQLGAGTGQASQPKNSNAMVEQQATTENQLYKDRRPEPSDFTKGEEKREMVKQMATREQQRFEDKTPQATDKSVVPVANAKSRKGVLYAQEMENGYQLVDSTPKIVLRLQKTSVPNYFIAKGDDASGTVFEKNGTWYFEYYVGEKLVTEALDIKF